MDLEKFVTVLDRAGELLRVKEPVSTRLELSVILEWADRKNGKAVLFERVDGHRARVVGNLFSRRSRLALAFGVDEDALLKTYSKRLKRRIKPKLVRSGAVMQSIIADDIDLARQVPVLTHREGDAGPYLTSAVTIAKDPETGAIGMGIYRIQVRGRTEVALNIQNPPLSDFLRKAEAMGVELEVAMVVGMDPLMFLASVSPVPPGADRYEIAGGLSGKAVQLVPCRTIDLCVPADSQYVFEGKVRPSARVQEGPFGESWGTYQQGFNPVAKLAAICHRKSPTYHALMPYSGEEPSLMGLITEAVALQSLESEGLHASALAIDSFNRSQLVVQMKKQNDEEPRRVLEHLLSRLPTVKTAVAVDADIDPRDPYAVGFAIATRFQPGRGAVILDGLRASSLDPSATVSESGRISSKLGMDATLPLSAPKRRFAMVRSSARAAGESLALGRLRRKLGKITR